MSDILSYSHVNSFDEFINANFHNSINAVGWMRDLNVDFREIVERLTLEDNITEVYPEDLLDLELSENGKKAREIILNDYQSLLEYGAQPSINLIKNYQRDDELDFISTDVYSYHVDRSPVGLPTFLCTYFGAASDIIPNNQAIQKIKIPSVREKLKAICDESESNFEDFLKEHFFDLHYEALPDAQPINLGNGNLWKLAVDHPNQKVLPCVHRAPKENDNELRLMLIC